MDMRRVSHYGCEGYATDVLRATEVLRICYAYSMDGCAMGMLWMCYRSHEYAMDMRRLPYYTYAIDFLRICHMLRVCC